MLLVTYTWANYLKLKAYYHFLTSHRRQHGDQCAYSRSSVHHSWAAPTVDQRRVYSVFAKECGFPFLVNNGTKRCSAQTIDNETVRDNCTILIRALGSQKTFLMSIMLSFDPCILTSVGSGPTRDCFGSFYLFRKLFSF